MKIDANNVLHIARLSRLDLIADEEVSFQRQLSDILAYVEKLNEIVTSNVDATSHVLEIQNAFRIDAEGPSLEIRDALSNAPETSGNFYKVPKIID